MINYPELLEDKARVKATENIQKWDLQDRDILLLCMMEELDELTQVRLERQSGEVSHNLNAEYNELYDLTALMYQYMIQCEIERFGYDYTEGDLIEGL